MTHGGLIYLKAPCIYMTSYEGNHDKYLDKCPTTVHLYSIEGILNLPTFLVDLFTIIHTLAKYSVHFLHWLQLYAVYI